MPVQVLSPQITHTSARLSYKVSCFQNPPHPYQVDDLIERLTELRKTVNLYFLVYYIGYNSGAVKCQRCIGQNMLGCVRVVCVRCFYAFSSSVTPTLPVPFCVHQPRSFPNTIYQRFYRAQSPGPPSLSQGKLV